MPGQEWRVLSLQALGALVASVVAAGLAWREVPFVFPRWNDVLDALRLGASMFLFRSAVSLYTVGNAFILGLFVSPRMVGYYAGAEKISKALLSLVQPVSSALYPRLSHLVREAPLRAARLARISFAVMGGSGVVMGLCACLCAPLLVRLILGAGYEPAVPILRILAALPMLIALSNVLGIQWMLPLGLDRVFNLIIVAAGGFNLLLGLTLASRFAGQGMAISVVTAEALVTVAMFVYLTRHDTSPFAVERALPEQIPSGSCL
jgi:PST family polysaccharide transporter